MLSDIRLLEHEQSRPTRDLSEATYGEIVAYLRELSE
jgi:hypothetical protein